MKATELKLTDFLSKTDTQFVIPIYQRNYDWKINHCQQLIDDILEAGKQEKVHFIGSIVYVHLVCRHHVLPRLFAPPVPCTGIACHANRLHTQSGLLSMVGRRSPQAHHCRRFLYLETHDGTTLVHPLIRYENDEESERKAKEPADNHQGRRMGTQTRLVHHQEVPGYLLLRHCIDYQYCRGIRRQ